MPSTNELTACACAARCTSPWLIGDSSEPYSAPLPPFEVQWLLTTVTSSPLNSNVAASGGREVKNGLSALVCWSVLPAGSLIAVPSAAIVRSEPSTKSTRSVR